MLSTRSLPFLPVWPIYDTNRSLTRLERGRSQPESHSALQSAFQPRL